MSEKEKEMEEKVPFQFIIDIFRWLLEINFHKYGGKGDILK